MAGPKDLDRRRREPRALPRLEHGAHGAGARQPHHADAETTALNWPYYDTIGTPLTPDVRISERFTLNEDQAALTYRQTVTDPATFTEPAVHESQHLALGESIERFVCAADL